MDFRTMFLAKDAESAKKQKIYPDSYEQDEQIPKGREMEMHARRGKELLCGLGVLGER